MPSHHPLTNVKSSLHWLTTNNKKKKPKTHQAPIQNDSNNNSNNTSKRATNLNPKKPSSYQIDPPHLPKPEPAVHRLQELKSPPPLPVPSSKTGPDSPGFKSRPLYRRTRSSPARDRAEEGGVGVRGDVAIVEKVVGDGSGYGGGGGGRKADGAKESEDEGGWVGHSDGGR